MDVQCIERIPDFVRHAGGKQRQRLNAFALDGLERLLSCFGRIVQNQGQPRSPLAFSVKRRCVEPKKAWSRIAQFELMPGNFLAAGAVQFREFLPIEIWQETENVLSLDQ